jgi:aspartate carbamoyltransferase catalytic subunit
MAQVMTRTIKKVPALQGFTVGTLFFENSTRTRLSFERAARAQSADVISFAAGGSSVSKGESLKDTLRTIDAMQADLYVVRHPAAGAPHQLRAGPTPPSSTPATAAAPTPPRRCSTPTPSRPASPASRLRGRQAGDRRRRAALARRAQQRRAVDQARRAGDALRPAHAAPRRARRGPGVTLTHRLEEAVEGAHAVMALRLQRERMASGLLPSLAEYRQRYQVTRAAMRSRTPTRSSCTPAR